MTAAAMTCSSTPVPRPTCAAFSRADVTAAAIAASMPIAMNVFMTVQPHVDSGEQARVWVAADPIDVPAESASIGEERHDDRRSPGPIRTWNAISVGICRPPRGIGMSFSCA